MFRNGLVVGVILLFIGISIQPVVAVNPISSDNEEDCNICPKISKLQVLEKYQKLFDKITTFTEMNKEVKPDYPYPIICNILSLYVEFQFAKITAFKSITEILPDILGSILYILFTLKNAYFIIGALLLYFGKFDCEEFELPYW